jgi:rod shape-determining protein MreD
VKKVAALVLGALLLAAVQSALLHVLGGGAFSVSLLAACVVYLGLHAGNVEGAVGAAGIGLVQDAMLATPAGLFTSLAVALFLVTRAVAAAVDVRSRPAFAVLSGAGALFLSAGGAMLLHWAVSPEVAPRAAIIPRMLLEAVLTGALSPLVLGGMRAIDRLFTREEAGLLR